MHRVGLSLTNAPRQHKSISLYLYPHLSPPETSQPETSNPETLF